MNQLKVLWNGIIKENPTFVLLLGACILSIVLMMFTYKDEKALLKERN